jgi:nitroreductase
MCRRNMEASEMVHHYIDEMVEKTWANKDDLAGYRDMMLWFFSHMSEDAIKTWADKQIYIALWNIMTALPTLEIDACPMEWFINDKYDEVLWLSEKGLSSVLVLPMGYRHIDDDYAKRPKVRYDNEEIFA